MRTEKKTVLIVDDSILIMERMIPILEMVDNISFVVQAVNFMEAVEVLATLKPDVVLLDINLPDKSGIELLRYIRQQHMDVTVLMFTNQSGSYYEETCSRLGADDFLDKSSDIERLSDILSAA